MTIVLAIAGALAVILATGHSLLGEVLIFRGLRPGAGLSPRHVSVLRGTWHLLSLFGCGFAAVFFVLALGTAAPPSLMLRSIGATFLISSLYWVWATRGGHPAWIVLGAIGLLSVYAQAG